MPGMMDTILNLGLNDATVGGLAAQSGNARFAYDSYRRFIQMYADVVLELEHHVFEEILGAHKDVNEYKSDVELSAEDWKQVVREYKRAVERELGKPFPADPKEQLRGAIGAVFASWMNPRAITYRNKIDGSQSLVLMKGHVVPGQPTLVRMHGISVFADLLGQPGPRKRVLQRSMQVIGDEGAGVIVVLFASSPGGFADEIARAGGKNPPDMDLRNYGIGAQILADLGIHDMVLLTNAHRNIVALEGYGINVVGEQIIPEGD